MHKHCIHVEQRKCWLTLLLVALTSNILTDSCAISATTPQYKCLYQHGK
jgi:hypothetical protein